MVCVAIGNEQNTKLKMRRLNSQTFMTVFIYSMTFYILYINIIQVKKMVHYYEYKFIAISRAIQ